MARSRTGVLPSGIPWYAVRGQIHEMPPRNVLWIVLGHTMCTVPDCPLAHAIETLDRIRNAESIHGHSLSLWHIKWYARETKACAMTFRGVCCRLAHVMKSITVCRKVYTHGVAHGYS